MERTPQESPHRPLPPVPEHARANSRDVAADRVGRYLGHAMSLLKTVCKENLETLSASDLDAKEMGRITSAYDQAFADLETLAAKAEQQVRSGDSQTLTEKQIKKLSKQTVKWRSEAAGIIAGAQRQTISTLAAHGAAGKERQLVEAMGEGRPAATRDRKAKKAAQRRWQDAAAWLENTTADRLTQQAKAATSVTKLTEGIIDKFEHRAAHRDWFGQSKQVVVLDSLDHVFVAPSTDKKQIAKQILSLESQAMTRKEWTTVRGTISDAAAAEFVPLNADFDAATGHSAHFEGIYGKHGISSKHRTEPLLVNAWSARVEIGGRRVFCAIRHGALAARETKDPARRIQARTQMAQHLATASLMQEISDQGLTLEQLASRPRDQPFEMSLSSVGLMTPDALRSQTSIAGEDERQLLKDQLSALRALGQGVQELEIGGHTVRVKFNVLPFNFGVNAASTGDLIPGVQLGLHFQHRENAEGLRNLEKLVQEAIKSDSLSSKDKADVLRLWQDIHHLTRNRNAYLNEAYQYEVGAKILLLCQHLPNCQSAFNCKSGKDRTSWMAAYAMALATLRQELGYYPSTQELKEGTSVRKRLDVLTGQSALKGGSLKITRVVSDACGLMVGQEARTAGVSKQLFAQIQGLARA